MIQIRRLLCCLVVSFQPAFAQVSTPTEIRVAHALSDDSHLGRAIAAAGERIKRESGGRLVVKALGNSVAGNDTKAMQDAIAGKLEMFISATTTIVPLYKPLAIWDTPFLFATREEAHAVLDSKVGQSLLEGVSAEGLVGLAYWELGFRNLTNNVRPVTRVEDFAGIRLRTMPSEVSINHLPTPGRRREAAAFSRTALRVGQQPVRRPGEPVSDNRLGRACTRCRSTSP